MHFLITTILAILGGVLPALIWLMFWLREDKNPEPPKLIIRSFLYGMYMVPLTLIFQHIIKFIFIQDKSIKYVFLTNYSMAILTIVLWVIIEEYLKYRAAYHGGLKTKHNDEPIDPTIYMITAALGFAALENTLYIFWPLLTGNSLFALIDGNMRFIGATLLHVATAAIIGLFISFSFYKNKKIILNLIGKYVHDNTKLAQLMVESRINYLFNMLKKKQPFPRKYLEWRKGLSAEIQRILSQNQSSFPMYLTLTALSQLAVWG